MSRMTKSIQQDLLGFKMVRDKVLLYVLLVDIIQLFLYGQPMGRVSKYTYLGLWFNTRYTWKDHVINV
jgi:hypothetical protein